MQEVRLTRLAAEQMTSRLARLVAEIELETRRGLPADWTSIAEGFDALRDLAEHGASNAWRVAYETESLDAES